MSERTKANISTIKTAIEAIKWYHGAAKRCSGEPFYCHPMEVAKIVLDYSQEEATILGALLHDTVEDTHVMLESIEAMFGKTVAEIVDGVTHLESYQHTLYKVKLASHENILSMLAIEDKRVWYIKLADRLHNMRTIQYKPQEKQRIKAEETLKFFVPLAKQLNLPETAQELKVLCQEVLAQ